MASSSPPSVGPRAEARLRDTAVTLAAAGRSAGVTTAITYDDRVGTSICDNRLRTSSNPTARPRSSTNGTIIRQTLAGRWVNTMVLIGPIRLAMRAAIRYEIADSRLVARKIFAVA